ncbi:hypothetical protein BC937DRAFT_86184 [Endogone sp. FLAS-F59071]|nr:hypothetical protein BC937DRAFT_86184 [Endogone sp. FLAS-F59071]|eukprot:RUS13188.1 hypothetical protein BC937DRAFT_86184 [Endogone sp. FLAS-F59071]
MFIFPLFSSFCKIEKIAGQPFLRHTQNSVLRSNCMDCLDRTNVVQSTFARWALTRQLQAVGILGQNEKVEDLEDFMKLFRNVWADNADSISVTYSGTGALKTDFTRTGSRSKAGLVQDFFNSATRYIKNNYSDGSRQDAFDLLLGNYDVRSSRSPFSVAKPLRVRIVPLVAIFAFAMLSFAFLIPSAAGISPRSSSSILFLSFWISVIVAACRFVFQHAEQYVDWPKLVPLPYLEEPTAALYVAPGKSGKVGSAVHMGRSRGLAELEKGGESVPMKKLT